MSLRLLLLSRANSCQTHKWMIISFYCFLVYEWSSSSFFTDSWRDQIIHFPLSWMPFKGQCKEGDWQTPSVLICLMDNQRKKCRLNRMLNQEVEQIKGCYTCWIQMNFHLLRLSIITSWNFYQVFIHRNKTLTGRILPLLFLQSSQFLRFFFEQKFMRGTSFREKQMFNLKSVHDKKKN